MITRSIYNEINPYLQTLFGILRDSWLVRITIYSLNKSGESVFIINMSFEIYVQLAGGELELHCEYLSH